MFWDLLFIDVISLLFFIGGGYSPRGGGGGEGTKKGRDACQNFEDSPWEVPRSYFAGVA